jgi:diacylglycerol kinase
MILSWIQPARLWFGGRAKSFAYALRGLRILVDETNARIHFVATILVVVAGLAFRLPRFDWTLLVVAMLLVWVTEALNTALESLADAAVPSSHPLVKSAKDVAAGAVLLAAVGAAVIGGIVFIPRVCQLIR